jgi:hypothetical protein
MNEIVHKVIEFTEEGLKSHEDYNTLAYDPGIQARVLDTQEDDEFTTIELDMTEFVKHNSKQMLPNWVDRSGQRILKWNETQFYPLDHKTKLKYYTEFPPFELR